MSDGESPADSLRRAERVTPSQHGYASGFACWFWAFPFLALSFGPIITVGKEQISIDLLPDFMGYLLIALGAQRLVTLHAKARSIRNLALLLNCLTLPTFIQYRRLILQSDNIDYWAAPTLPFGILLAASGLLDLVLAWKVCSLIADVARRADAPRTAESALFRRNVYILVKVVTLAVGGLAFANPSLLFPAAVLSIITGVLVLCLMMGLMKQAQHICRAGLPTEDGPLPPQNKVAKLVVRLVLVFSILASLVLLVGLFGYYEFWKRSRDPNGNKTGPGPGEVYQAFLSDIRQDRFDAAYQRLTPGLQQRLTREAFENLVHGSILHRYLKGGGGISGRGGGGSSGPFEYANTDTFMDDKSGKRETVSVRVLRGAEDSILLPHPPPFGIDAFTVEEGDPPPPRPMGR